MRKKGGAVGTRVGRTSCLVYSAFLSMVLAATGDHFPFPCTVRMARAADQCVGCAKVLNAIATSESPEALTITLILDKVVYPKVFTLKEPMRLVVDIEPAWMGPARALAIWRHPLLKGQIRSAWHAESKRVRLVLDLHPGVVYEVEQDLYIGQGGMGGGARFVLLVRQARSG